MSPDAPITRTPSTIGGRYRILEELGSGRDGTVCLAYDEVRCANVALKWVVTETARIQGALFREFEIGTRLDHPSWPRTFDYGRQGPIEYFTMEPVDGTPLDGAVARLTRPELASLLACACRGLEALHREGIVHADLHPEHLLVSGIGGEPRLTLIDLSLALDRDTGAAAGGDAHPDRNLVRGSLEFASPAVLAGERPKDLDDLYALGASFARCLAGLPAGEVPGAGGDGLDRIVARLTSGDPDTRYASAREVERALVEWNPELAVEARAPERPARRAPLLGRGAGLEACERFADAFARDPRGRRTRILAAPGMGASRLLAEVRRRLHVRGFTCVHVAQSAPTDWGRLVRGALWRSREAGARPPAELVRLAEDPAALRDPTTEQAVDLLARVARLEPLVVCVDAPRQETGRDLGEALASLPPDLPLWLLTTERVDPGTPFSSSAPEDRSPATQETNGRCPVQVVPLAPLPPDLARELARGILPPGDPWDGWVAERLFEHCAGHPAFTLAAAESLACGPDPRDLSGEAVDVRIDASMPPSARSVVRARSNALDGPARNLAEEFAVFAAGIPPGKVRALAADPATSGAVATLEASGLLECRSRSQAGGVWTLAESVRRDLAARTPPEAWNARQRQALAAWTAEPESPARTEALALHALELAIQGDPQADPRAAHAASDACLRAADAWMAEQAFAPAARLLLRWVEGSGPGGAAASLSPRAASALLVRLAECQIRSGRLGPAERTLERAAGYGDAGEDGLRLGLVWAEVLDGQGRLEDARRKLQDALRTGGTADPEIRARAFGVLGRLEYRLGDPASAERALQQGLDGLAGRPPSEAAASLGNDLGVLAFLAGRFDESLERHRWTLAMRERMGDRDGIARSLTNLGSVHMSCGRYRPARERLEASLVLKRQLGNPQSIALTLANLALLDHWLGHYASSIERHEESLKIREGSGALSDQARSLTHLARVLHDKGAYTRALRRVDRSLELIRRTGERDEGFVHAQCARAEILNTIGQVTPAGEAIAEGLAAADVLGHELGRGVLLGLRAEQRAQRDPMSREHIARIQGDLDAAVTTLRPLGQPLVLAETLLRSCRVQLQTPGLDMSLDWLAEGQRIAEELEARALGLAATLLRAEADLVADRPNEASSKLFEVVDGARSLSARDLLWRAYEGLARFHSHYGRSERVLLWLQRCIGTFREVVERMPTEDMQTAYLNAPARRRIVERASDWAEPQGL